MLLWHGIYKVAWNSTSSDLSFPMLFLGDNTLLKSSLLYSFDFITPSVCNYVRIEAQRRNAVKVAATAALSAKASRIYIYIYVYTFAKPCLA